MKIWSDSFKDGKPIPARYAFGKPNPETHVELSDNINPHIAWSDLPKGSRSLVLICHDSDVPTKPDNVNKEGTTVPATLQRADFFHWILVDIAKDASSIQEGAFCKGVTPKGKRGPSGPQGTRQGINNYMQWFEGDADMAGKYFGYDGPCPPWNDEIVHHYHFTIYALDVDRCPVEKEFSGDDVLKAIKGHVLDKASMLGMYAIYPNAK